MERRKNGVGRYPGTPAQGPDAGLPAACRLIHEVSPGEMPALLPAAPVRVVEARPAAAWASILRRLFGRPRDGRGSDALSGS